MVRLLLSIFVFVFVASSPVRARKNSDVCALSYCECLPGDHPSWTVVNCTMRHNQKLDLLEGDLPESTTDLIINGAETVIFGANSLSRLNDARHIGLYGAKIILIRQFAALYFNVVNVYLEIDNCNFLRIEQKAFSNIKGPLSVTIADCDYVSLEGMAFSWLLTLSISNVPHLEAGSEAFMLDPTAANVGEHGPGMMIQLKNLTVSEFAAQTFGSSAAGITMEGIEVHTIRAAAFSANTYNIVMAVNCSFYLIEGESFAQNSLINSLELYGSKVHQISSNALQSAVANLNISHCRFENVETGAINATVANVAVLDNKFVNFMEKGLELSSWNNFLMERNSFDELPTNAIVATGTSAHELIFVENEIETAKPKSLAFISQAYTNSTNKIRYKNNYFGQTCHCNITTWLSKIFGMETPEGYQSESYCTVDKFFARCFNVPDQNIIFDKFLKRVCTTEATIQCDAFYGQNNADEPKIKNPRFPHKSNKKGGLNDRQKKVIGIVIVTCLACAFIVLFISLIKWIRRKRSCLNMKNFLVTSYSSCGLYCDRLCYCDKEFDNARSISQISVNEYFESHGLNEPCREGVVQEIISTDMYTDIDDRTAATEDKTTQTLPEELTKELLEHLREKLEDPESYIEAQEMIEHLYEIIRAEESCNANTPIMKNKNENIYQLPFQNTVPKTGKNKMISVGTRTPSIEKLIPLSPYHRQTALANAYFEPKDFAVHLYSEIATSEKKNKKKLCSVPGVAGEQSFPRGPYLRAKLSSSCNRNPSCKPELSSPASLHQVSTVNSNKSTSSIYSENMVNRPLPEKPVTDMDE